MCKRKILPVPSIYKMCSSFFIPTPPPKALTEHSRDLKFGMRGPQGKLFGLNRAIFATTSLSWGTFTWTFFKKDKGSWRRDSSQIGFLKKGFKPDRVLEEAPCERPPGPERPELGPARSGQGTRRFRPNFERLRPPQAWSWHFGPRISPLRLWIRPP